MGIKAIGCEIEMAYKQEDRGKVDKISKVTLCGDGSICARKGDMDEIEVVTNPFDYKDIDKLKAKIQEVGKYVGEINKTMGFHVHISFDSYEDYCKVLDYQFEQEFLEEYKANFKTLREKARLENDFCGGYKTKKEFDRITALALASLEKNHRYYAVNFNAYPVHNTIEFRIFPMNKADRLCEYIDFLDRFINNWFQRKSHEGSKAISEAVMQKPSIKGIRICESIEEEI
jgi:hypothetical protein